MATLAHAEPVHLYSLWGNHISPKNSKWIQENLKDMDVKIEEIMKLIDGDADTFARRADMYYKKRPELKKLVEEFYRGYRALAERYEHSTRALRHAHRTIAEAFPNQIPFSLSDESPYGLYGVDVESPSSEILRSQFDPDDLRKGSFGSFGSFSDFHTRKRNSLDSEDSDPLSSRKGVKQYNEMLAAGEGAVRANAFGGQVRKVLSFLEVDAKTMENKAPNQDYEGKVKQDANSVINNLHQDISKLSSEIHVLKDQIMEESKRANNAENEIQSLRGTLSKSDSERDETLLQHQRSLERISNLELLLSNTGNELKKLSDDMTKELKKLKNIEELNESLQLDLDTLEKKARMQENELNQKQEELEKLQTTLEDKYQKCLEAEMALESTEKKYIQSQEEIKSLGVEIQDRSEKLRNVELHNKGLEEEICKLKEENNDLNEQMVHSTSMIKGLQDEITLLSESKTKLEGEIRILLEEKEILSQELNRVKEEKNDLECRHQNLVEKLQAISLCVESLQAAVKELENGNYELKEVCKKHEAEKALLVEKLKDMDKISEKNIMLEKFLLDANIELEALREKVVALESTHESLKSEISIYVSERDSLASQVKILSESVEMLSTNNTFLENSLSDARTEVESLRSKLKDSEESCQFLSDQNSSLVSEKDTLLSQVENVTMNLEDLERRYAEVMEKHLKLSRERDQLIDQLKELEDNLNFEKQEQEIRMVSYKNLLGTSENQISILQEENQQREKELQSEQHNLICASIENFILQRSLYDLKEGNMFLFLEGQKHLESCKTAERLIFELDQERLIQQRSISSLSKRNERIRKGICELFEAFTFEQVFESPEEIKDEVLLDIILSKIRKLLASISEVEGDNQRMHLEISVIGTILRHLGIDVVHLGSQKYSLERELEIKNGKLFALANERHELLERNDLLMRDLEASNQREELLNTEINALSTQLTDLQEVIQIRQLDIANLTEDKKNLSQHFCTLKRKHDILEEEHFEVLVETIKLDHLYLLFKSLYSERLMELKSLNDDVESLHAIKNNLGNEISRLNEKMNVLVTEKMHFSDYASYLEEELRNHILSLELDLNIVTCFFEELDIHAESTKNILVERETELFEANQKVHSIQEKNMTLKELLEASELDNAKIKLVKEEMEMKTLALSEVIINKNQDIGCLDEENKKMKRDIDRIHKRLEVFLCREEHLVSELEKEASEILQCEEEIRAMMNDIHILTVNAAFQDEKFHELLVANQTNIGCLDEENKKMKRDIDRIHKRLEVFLCREEHLVSELEKEASEILQCEEEIRAMMNDIHILTVNAAFQDEKFHELLVANQTSTIVQKEVLVSELYFIKEYMEELQNKLYELEGENRGLKADIDSYLLMLSSLWDDIASLEDQIMSISQLKLLSDQTKEDMSLMSHQHHNSNQPTENCTAKKARVGLLLEQLNNKVKALQRMTGHTIRLLEQDIIDSNASLDAARKEVETLKASVFSGQGKEATECSEAEFEQMTKDIQLDQTSSSLISRDVVSDMPNVRSREIDDQSWANTGKYNMIFERLDSDAQKLSDLKTNIEELKKRVNSQTYKPAAIYGYDPINEQLREAEGAMFDLTDANIRLKMMAEDCSSNGLSTNSEDKGSSKRSQISEQAKLGSEKIGRLQLKLQKIQYVLMKLEEEHESRQDKAAARNRVILRDYLYGRADHHKQKGNRFCGFARPKTKGDY